MDSYPTGNRSLITALNLAPHPEGGYFVETYRQTDVVPSPFAHGSKRSLATSIYYLLTPERPKGFFHMNKSRPSPRPRRIHPHPPAPDFSFDPAPLERKPCVELAESGGRKASSKGRNGHHGRERGGRRSADAARRNGCLENVEALT